MTPGAGPPPIGRAEGAPAQVTEHTFVILGGMGDLAGRKLLPAVFRMVRDGRLKSMLIVAASRNRTIDDDAYRRWARQALLDAGFAETELSRWCDECLFYEPVGEGSLEDYEALGERIRSLEQGRGRSENRIFYLALPPEGFSPAIESLGRAGLNHSSGWTRIVVEKPFGRDLDSARSLNEVLHRSFDETQIYRIDHYLGKETVQNVLCFRFANPIFESQWNRERIGRVEITVSESLGVEGRGGYYEQAGVLRDMIQNHLTQLLTLIAMEVPGGFGADEIRFEKIKALRSIPSIGPEDVVYGQYGPGQIEGKAVVGYQAESRVAPDSKVPTFVALRLSIQNWRWQGVPFLLRTGKRLPRRSTRIAVVFRRPPVSIFRDLPPGALHGNVLRLDLEPDEGFHLTFDVKKPGSPRRFSTEVLQFLYREAFEPLPPPYETLLVDVVQGDQTLFVHSDEVEASWRLYTPVLQQERPVFPYPAGSWGPGEADALLNGEAWMMP